MRNFGTRIALLLLTFVAIGALYALAIRPWILNWGSSAEERVRELPGDGIVVGAANSTTRAVTIAAAADKVFPWVAQLGRNRGGFYSYELLEDLVGSEMPRATTLLPGAQEWRPGDNLSMYPYDKAGGAGEAPRVYPSGAARAPYDATPPPPTTCRRARALSSAG